MAAGAPSGAPDSHETLRAKSMFGIRSGWSLSRPVSRSPTTTAGLPPVIAFASGAWICRMSHCSGASGSTPAGAFGRSPGDASAPSTSSGPTFATGLVEAATDSIRLSFANACANVALSDLAIATPMAS